MEELELITSQLAALEAEMEETLKKTEISEYLLSIDGMGVVSLATCLGDLILHYIWALLLFHPFNSLNAFLASALVLKQSELGNT